MYVGCLWLFLAYKARPCRALSFRGSAFAKVVRPTAVWSVFRVDLERKLSQFDRIVFVLTGGHVLSVDGRRHIPRLKYGGPKKWRWFGRAKMAAVGSRSALAGADRRPQLRSRVASCLAST